MPAWQELAFHGMGSREGNGVHQQTGLLQLGASAPKITEGHVTTVPGRGCLAKGQGRFPLGEPNQDLKDR